MPVTRNQSAFSQGNKSNLGQSQPAASTESSEEGASTEAPRRDSPDNCSICLGPFNNKSFTSNCAHSFCFVCLKQWSKVKAECPLCKQPFTSIFHNVRSNDSYDIFDLPPRNVPPPSDINFFDLVGGNLRTMTVAAPSANEFHNFFNLSHPSLNADLTLSNFSRFQFRHRRYLGQHHHNQHPVHGEHQYSYSGVQVNPATHINGENWPRGPENFRREIYRRRMGPPAVVLGMETSTYRLTPAMVAASDHRMHRIMPWLTRELRVLLQSHQSLRLAISVIQPLLTQFSLDSGEFLNRVTPLLGRRSQQFMQQFVAFANSALTMQVYDRRAMYQRPDYSNMLPVSSSGSSSSDDDVVEITSISSASNNNTINNNNRESSGAIASGSRIASSAVPSTSLLSGLLSNHGWDSPIPGPSWERLNVVDDDDDVQIQEDPVSVSSETDDPVYRPDARNLDSDDSKAGSDLVFLKYDKPWNERSPINLSSSSEAEEPVDHSKKKKKSKHKKKNKEQESKTHKPSLKIKIRRKHKARRSKDNDEDDYEVGSDSSDEGERRQSQSIGSGDRSSGKRHKKSRDRSRKNARKINEKNNDRELVDRLFAETITQSNITSIFEDEPTNTLQAESVEKTQSSGKAREKRKKKRKNSSSPSSRAYKKHHSGHKKSSAANRTSHTHRHSSREAAAGLSGQTNVSTATAEASMSPSVQRPGTFQPSFLPIPDTVQHIPLNLWVSTWPALSVSTHAFGSGPPTSSALPPPLPHAINLAPRAGGNSLAPRTISSSSSSDNASEDEQQEGDNKISSAPGSHKRTKQWVESNFFNNHSSIGKEKVSETASSSLVSTSQPSKSQEAPGSTSQQSKKTCNFSTDFLLNFDTSKLTSNTDNPSARANYTAKQTIELVCSSGDEQNKSEDEVLVCSSDNGAASDTDSENDGDTSSQTGKIQKNKSEPIDHRDNTINKDVHISGQDVYSSNTVGTGSRLLAYKQSSSRSKADALSPHYTTVSATQQNHLETGTPGNILDFVLDCEQPNLDNPSSSKLKQLEKNPEKTTNPHLVEISTVAASYAPNVLTTSTCHAPKLTISHTDSSVTTTPFFIYPGCSSQTSSICMSSVQPGDGSYLPYSTIPTAPISFPPLIPPSVPLGLPKVPNLPNAFPFHQSLTSMISPAAELFPVCTSNEEISACRSQESSRNTGSNLADEGRSIEAPSFPAQLLTTEQTSQTSIDRISAASKPDKPNGTIQTLPNPFPLLAAPSACHGPGQQTINIPFNANPAPPSALNNVQTFTEENASPNSSVAQDMHKNKSPSKQSIIGNSEEQKTTIPFPAPSTVVRNLHANPLFLHVDQIQAQTLASSSVQCNSVTETDQPSASSSVFLELENDNKTSFSKNETEIQSSVKNTSQVLETDLLLSQDEMQYTGEDNITPLQDSNTNLHNSAETADSEKHVE
ncbi:hypothetical protein EGW08_022237 [Elysia chlorotica]|uniref:E3 ubiquitin-protein ligase Topors n=1 Tax=Elysia chlorotica TaxID=188477 RepID=A0A3S0Z9R1_ELYCH|nr:hypothetical protein EGW08_022237 [Elysia chlorotica]